MSKDNVIEGQVSEEVNVEVVEKESMLSKARSIGKKHGKKIIAGVALIGTAAISYAVGKQSGIDSVTMDIEDDSDFEIVDYGDDDSTEI